MSFFIRKAYIEFFGKKEITITTLFRQKSFILSDSFCVNLISLNKIEEEDFESLLVDPPSPFMVYFFYDDESNSFVGEIIAQISEHELDVVGRVDWVNDNKKLFYVSVWDD